MAWERPPEYDDPPDPPEEPPWSEKPAEPIDLVIDELMNSWDEWDAEAMQEAQAMQSSEAWAHVMRGRIWNALQRLIPEKPT